MIDWGSVPDWLAGTGAVAALIFARAAARSARDSSRSQQDQIRRLQLDEENRQRAAQADQAARVAAWVTTFRPERDSGEGESVRDLRVGVRFSNGSALPVYQLLIVATVDAEAFEDRYTVMGPQTLRRVLGYLSRRVTEAVAESDPGELLSQDRIIVSCSMRDSSGLWWARDEEGKLTQCEDQGRAEVLARKRTRRTVDLDTGDGDARQGV